MKRKIFYIAAIIICLSIISGGTLAYFTAEDTATNVITSGDVDVSVIEQQLVGGEIQPYPAEPVNIMPGTSISKIVSARSMAQEAWVRMSYTLTVFGADGEKLPVPGRELEKMISVRVNIKDWISEDDWWYYPNPVSSGDTTAPFFEEVVFSGPDIGNEYQNCTVIIDVNAQAVQKAHNGTTVMEASGWPET